LEYDQTAELAVAVVHAGAARQTSAEAARKRDFGRHRKEYLKKKEKDPI
jgi:hypothetical protein